MDKIYDCLIIGGGPAGYTAALYAVRAGLSAAVIEGMSVGGQMTLTSEIDNYPGFDEGIDGFTLGLKMQQGAHRFGAETVFGEVTAVDFSEKIKKVTLADGELCGKTIIIATGANPRTLGVAREEEFTGRGVHYCAHCDGRFYKGKTVAVIGGGNSAVQDALYLSGLAQKVILVHRRDVLRASKVYHDKIKSIENIEFKWNSTLEEFIGENRIEGIRLGNTVSGQGEEVACDGVFVSIGRSPATKIFKDIVSLDDNGYILADESTKTNIKGVFAAGDVRTKALRQIVTAVSDGATAVYQAEEYLREFA